jgi:hypothetical protein
MVGSSSGNGVPAAIEGPVPKRALPPEDGAPHGPPSDGASPCKRPRTAGPPESPSPVVHVGGLVSWGIGKLQWWLGGMCSLSEACSLLEKRCKVTTKGRRAGARRGTGTPRPMWKKTTGPHGARSRAKQLADETPARARAKKPADESHLVRAALAGEGAVTKRTEAGQLAGERTLARGALDGQGAAEAKHIAAGAVERSGRSSKEENERAAQGASSAPLPNPSIPSMEIRVPELERTTVQLGVDIAELTIRTQSEMTAFRESVRCEVTTLLSAASAREVESKKTMKWLHETAQKFGEILRQLSAAEIQGNACQVDLGGQASAIAHMQQVLHSQVLPYLASSSTVDLEQRLGQQRVETENVLTQRIEDLAYKFDREFATRDAARGNVSAIPNDPGEPGEHTGEPGVLPRLRGVEWEAMSADIEAARSAAQVQPPPPPPNQERAPVAPTGQGSQELRAHGDSDDGIARS